jgi:hypothetical protein
MYLLCRELCCNHIVLDMILKSELLVKGCSLNFYFFNRSAKVPATFTFVRVNRELEFLVGPVCFIRVESQTVINVEDRTEIKKNKMSAVTFISKLTNIIKNVKKSSFC